MTPEEWEGIKTDVEIEQCKQLTQEYADWISSLDPKDWLFDGYAIRSNDKMAMERWAGLNWPKAWLDMGPSPAGNLGPYWHVPLPSNDTVHRLYPKLLKTKSCLTIRAAIIAAVKAERTEATRIERERCVGIARGYGAVGPGRYIADAIERETGKE